MQLRMLRAFVEVVRQGGFSQASKLMHVTQSTMSKSVQVLEADLGERLLDRHGKRSALTAAGQIVYRHALAMLAEHDNLTGELAEMRGLGQGSLRLGLPPIGSDLLFAPLFVTYRSRFPGIEIRLVEHGSRRLEELLLAGDIDLAALLGPVKNEFEAQDVRREPLVALVASNHLLAQHKTVKLEKAAAFPFILFEEGFALNPIILNACSRRGLRPVITARSAQVNFIAELAAAGLGVAFLPRLIAEQLQHPGVRTVLVNEPDMTWHLMLSWRRGAYLPHASRAWLELSREFHRQR